MNKTNNEDKYVFRAADFHEMRQAQDSLCSLSGRLLEPWTCDIAHLLPLSKGGKHERLNLQLVHTDIVKLARQMTESEIVSLCCDVLRHVGRKYGISVRKTKRKDSEANR